MVNEITLTVILSVCLAAHLLCLQKAIARLFHLWLGEIELIAVC